MCYPASSPLNICVYTLRPSQLHFDWDAEQNAAVVSGFNSNPDGTPGQVALACASADRNIELSLGIMLCHRLSPAGCYGRWRVCWSKSRA